MKIDELIHVSGLPGLYKIGASRSNGIIIEDIDSGKSKFASLRKHQFTPLSTVAIYTESDATELSKVFESIATHESKEELPSLNTSSPILFGFFSQILPDFDRERVMISDVKKILKWYNFLKSRDLYPFDIEEEVVEVEKEEENKE